MKTVFAILLLAFIVLCASGWHASANQTMVAFAAGQAPTPMVSVTTLPAMPSVAPKAPSMTPTPVMPLVTPEATTAPAVGGGPTAPPLGYAVIPVEGQVSRPLNLTLSQLQHMKTTSLTLHFHVYTGVPLTDILAQAQPTFADDPQTLMRKYIYFQGIDGKNAILSYPEFSKAFNGQIILLAYTVDLKDVKPPGFAELVVQGDKTNARFIKIARIIVGEPSLPPPSAPH